MSAPTRITRQALLWAVSLSVLLLVACGRERPTFTDTSATTGSLQVESAPAGASIWLDGVDTGEQTPVELTGIRPGDHVVRLVLEGWNAEPESLRVTVLARARATATFTLREVQVGAPQVVLIESFSNVSCIGCPEMSDTIYALMQEPGFGLDRLLNVKFSMFWPERNDPHHVDRKTSNDMRLGYYQTTALTVGIPTLVVDGQLVGASGAPPELAALRSAAQSRLQNDPGFAITLTGEVAGAAPELTIQLLASRAIDLSDCVLRVALVEDSATHASPPGDQGETVLHWVLRDFKEVDDLPALMAADTPILRNVSLQRNPASWTEGTMLAVAFVQRDGDRRVLQAGSSAGP